MNALWSDWRCSQQSTVQWTCVSVWLHPMSHEDQIMHIMDYTSSQHLISSDEVHMQFPLWGERLSAINGQCVVLTGVKMLAICSKSNNTMLHQLHRLHGTRMRMEGVTAALTLGWVPNAQPHDVAAHSSKQDNKGHHTQWPDKGAMDSTHWWINWSNWGQPSCIVRTGRWLCGTPQWKEDIKTGTEMWHGIGLCTVASFRQSWSSWWGCPVRIGHNTNLPVITRGVQEVWFSGL